MQNRKSAGYKQGQAFRLTVGEPFKAWPCSSCKGVLSDSIIGNFMQKFCHPLVAEVLLLISLCLFWYEGVFQGIGTGLLSLSLVSSTMLLLAFLFSDKSKIRVTRPLVFLIVFYVLSSFSGVLASTRGLNVAMILSGWLLFVQFLVAILAAQGVAKPQRLLTNLLYLSIPMTLLGLYQFITQQETSRLWISPGEASIGTRAFATFGSPNVLGAILAILIPICLGLFFEKVSKDSPFKRTVLLTISILAVIALVMTFSRSSWLGLVIGVAIVLVFYRWKLMFFSPLALLPLLVTQVRERIATVFSASYWFDSTLDGRLWSLNNAFHLFAKYPVFGTGPGTYGGQLALNYASPVYLEGIQAGYVALYFTDNQWIQLLVQTGLVGVTLFVLFAVESCYGLLAEFRKSGSLLQLGILAAFISFIVTGFFGNVLEFGAISVFMGIILGVAVAEQDLVTSPVSSKVRP